MREMARMSHWEGNHHGNLGMPVVPEDYVSFGAREGEKRQVEDACRPQESVLTLALNSPFLPSAPPSVAVLGIHLLWLEPEETGRSWCHWVCGWCVYTMKKKSFRSTWARVVYWQGVARGPSGPGSMHLRG